MERCGRSKEASAEFERAATLTRNAREQELLLARAARAGTAPRPTPSGTELTGGH
jgi:predicted RNA polymerase sigma factor